MFAYLHFNIFDLPQFSVKLVLSLITFYIRNKQFYMFVKNIKIKQAYHTIILETKTV